MINDSDGKCTTPVRRILVVLSTIAIISILYLYFHDFVTLDNSLNIIRRINPFTNMQIIDFNQSDDDPDIYVNEIRYILDWTTFFGEPMVNSKGWLRGCEDFNCQMISDKSKLSESHAVLFHIRNTDWNKLPRFRKPEQYYVFYLMESPYHSNFDKAASANFFNLTISYRRDSDFYAPYGSFRQRGNSNELTVDENYVENLVNNKTKMVAWFVSNCATPSKRELYVQELQKHIHIDVFGACGKSHCPKTMSCNELLKLKYKFYLSFENSLCKDYVTEKLFDRIRYFVVPIVLNENLSSDFLPPHSVISVDDFPTVTDLADYLKYLNNNLTAYLEYFQWHKDYEVLSKYHDCPNQKRCGFCALCAFLHRQNGTKIIKKNAHDWWHKDANCDSNLVPRILSNTAKEYTTQVAVLNNISSTGLPKTLILFPGT